MKLVYFCVGNEEYVDVMCSTLTLVKKHNPLADFFIVGDIYNDNLINKIKKFNIKLYQCDYHKIYKYAQKRWPSQCFWWYAMPDIFYKKGYKFSCLVDGDIYCYKKINLNFLNDNFDIAAITTPKEKWNYKQWWSSLVFLNNKKLSEKKFFEKSIKIYNIVSSMEYPGKQLNDQHVLNGFLPDNMFHNTIKRNTNIELNIIPLELNFNWSYLLINYKNRNDNDEKISFDELKEKIIFLHLASTKPWNTLENMGGSHKNFLQKYKEKKTNKSFEASAIKFVNMWRKDVREYVLPISNVFDENSLTHININKHIL